MLRYVTMALLCFASSLLGSAFTILLLSPNAPESGPPPGLVVAREILLTDNAGRTRVRLQGETFAGATGGQIAFYDDRDVMRMKLAMYTSGPSIELQSSELPNPDHKRVRIAVDEGTARIDLGHGELEEVVLRSSPMTDPPANVVEVHARNGSVAALFTDVFGHATAEVTDLTTKSIFRAPQEKPLLP